MYTRPETHTHTHSLSLSLSLFLSVWHIGLHRHTRGRHARTYIHTPLTPWHTDRQRISVSSPLDVSVSVLFLSVCLSASRGLYVCVWGGGGRVTSLFWSLCIAVLLICKTQYFVPDTRSCLLWGLGCYVYCYCSDVVFGKWSTQLGPIKRQC